jgi:hypothetical protein
MVAHETDRPRIHKAIRMEACMERYVRTYVRTSLSSADMQVHILFTGRACPIHRGVSHGLTFVKMLGQNHFWMTCVRKMDICLVGNVPREWVIDQASLSISREQAPYVPYDVLRPVSMGFSTSCTLNTAPHQQNFTFYMKLLGERRKEFHHGETSGHSFTCVRNCVKPPLRHK